MFNGIYRQQPAYRLAGDLGLGAMTISRGYRTLRMTLYIPLN